jgi:hypothetical protein
VIMALSGAFWASPTLQQRLTMSVVNGKHFILVF